VTGSTGKTLGASCAAFLVAAALGTVPSTASAAPDWVGDFESGDLSQWLLSPQVIGNMDDITVTQDVVGEGSYAGRIELAPGTMSPSGHSRNEVVYIPDLGAFDGTERWYSFSLQPEGAFGDSWHLVWYWEGNPVFQQMMSMFVNGPQIQFRTAIGGETTLWTGAFTPGEWHDFILHVLWSPDPATGFVELYYDGAQVVPMTNTATMLGAGVGGEMHAGIIRDQNLGTTEVIYLDGFRDGATMEDVLGGDDGGTDTGDDDDDDDDDMADSGSGGDDDDDDDVPGDDDDDDVPGDDDDDDDDDDGADGNDGGSGGSGSDGAADGGDTDGGGCSCRTSAPTTWLGLLLLPFVRRRRR